MSQCEDGPPPVYLVTCAAPRFGCCVTTVHMGVHVSARVPTFECGHSEAGLLGHMATRVQFSRTYHSVCYCGCTTLCGPQWCTRSPHPVPACVLTCAAISCGFFLMFIYF